MITLEQALADQRDLRELIHRELPVDTTEVYERNTAYGWARILKEYAGYPQHLPIHAVIPHGVYFDAEQIAQEELDAPVPAVLDYPAFRRVAWERLSDKVVVPSASPFLYALSLFRGKFAEPEDPQGTVFYPVHGTETANWAYDRNAVIASLRALPDDMQPVSVCIHASDYVRGLHQPFVDAGFPLLSAGDTSDPQFIFRWLHLLSQFRFVAGNDVGGSAFYAVKAGKPFTLIGEAPVPQLDSALHFMQRQLGMFYRTTSEQMRRTHEQIRSAFLDQPDSPVTKDEMTDYLLGTANFKTPHELRAVLEQLAQNAEERGGTTAA